MGETAAPRRGYTFRLAGRHLIAGCLRPRAAMREALDAGLSEPRRLLLFGLGLCLLLALPDTRGVFGNHFKVVLASQSASLIAVVVFILLVLLSLLIVVMYAADCIVLAVALMLTLGARRSFATTRSVSALVLWITLLPGIALDAVMRSAGSPSLFPEPWTIAPVQTLILAPYCLLCVAEAFGLSILTSGVVVLLATAGDVLADAAIVRGLDLLIEFIQSFDKNIISA